MIQLRTAWNRHIRFLVSSPAGGALALLLASLAGFVMANGPWAGTYRAMVTLPMRLAMLGAHGPTTLNGWVSDGLMALFFLLVILEIRKEMADGHLSSPRLVALPLVGAVGGMIMPALIYLGVTWGHGPAMRGWAIPVATDAAFTLPIILALGARVSAAARTWLMTLAIFDDVLGIIVIALFYGSAPYWPAVLAAILVTAALVAASRAGTRVLRVYVPGWIILWGALLGSGLQPTLAGVIAGACLPATARSGHRSPSERVTRALAPFVTWLVLPLFGFMNVGVSLAGTRPGLLLAPVPLGIMLGLVVGKPVGVFGATLLAARLKLASLPATMPMGMLSGLCMLCGIGFTISLFIAGQAFAAPEMLMTAKAGIFAGSVLSALGGWVWLRFVLYPSRAGTMAGRP
ncbi:Na+/H+ antiporter NhaA [Komagataeibacter sp. FNDCF1]|uniref:Na+/H+ antiporter NhaA n=1 Tax=Komagataeibacter sp. FNDCF1 TaxID=2878681 RepID=UPI001E38484A|nr:Na+/H+ antiporter NhaA [Komagataeibacter sp. FNDCF1]MCE2563638.1 Na+/H+ antiporter NhaA [Komagataeibacter sp. FNDCF1]